MRALCALLLFSLLAATAPAYAVVKGTGSTLGSSVARVLVDARTCTGVVIARAAVVTAAHCGSGKQIVVGGRGFAVAGVATATLLDDGRRLRVSGDAVVLRIATALPPSVETAEVGEGRGEKYVIAGYGATDEARPGSLGTLHQAELVAAGPHTLVDPNRTGTIGASACFGDSGGPVLRGGVVVGIITRAAHPSPHRACGHLTHWVPMTVSDSAAAAEPTAREAAIIVSEQRPPAAAPLKRTQASSTNSTTFFGLLAPIRQGRGVSGLKAAQPLTNEFAAR